MSQVYRSMRILGAFLGVGLLAPACLFNSVAKLSDEGKPVQLVRETTAPVNCRVIEKITGSSKSDKEEEAFEGARNDFRNNAGRLKANYALVESERASNVGTTQTREVFIQGKALNCTTLAMEAEEEKRQEEARAKKEEDERKAQEEKERKEQEEKDKQAAEEAAAKEKAKEEAAAKKAKKK